MGSYLEVLKTANSLLKIDRVFVEDKESCKNVLSYCVKNNIEVVTLFKGQSIEKELFKGAELVIVASFGRIIKKQIIDSVNFIVNFHPGIIQNVRGRHPLPLAILFGHSMMGMTVHLIDSEEIDAGPILSQYRLPINYRQNYAYNDNKLKSLLVPMTKHILTEFIETGTLTSATWRPTNKYYPPLSIQQLKHIFKVKTLNSVKGSISQNENSY